VRKLFEKVTRDLQKLQARQSKTPGVPLASADRCRPSALVGQNGLIVQELLLKH
jgi:hypothetical protein